MNKKILLSLAVVLLLTSCTSEESGSSKHQSMVTSKATSNDKTGDASDNSSTTTLEKVVCEAHTHIKGNGTLPSIDGLTLELVKNRFESGKESQLEFRIKDSRGESLSNFAITHTKPVHLILIKKNFDGYLHLHPNVGADGLWSTPVTFDSGGEWQIVADFRTEEGENYNLGAFIKVAGTEKSFTLPDPVDSVMVDGIELNISGMVNADEHGMLMITASKQGSPVRLDEYLGANAHLVAIRKDGSYAHMHPHSMKSMEQCAENEMPVNDPYASIDAEEGLMHFMTEVPGSGTYRFFLQFMVTGKLYTAAFTMNVE